MYCCNRKLDLEEDEASPVFAFGIELLAENFVIPAATRHEGTFILIMRGLITFEVAHSLWVVPPRCALWIPSGMERTVRGTGSLEFYGLLITPKVQRELPNECCTMAVSPLLRELVIAMSRLQWPYAEKKDASNRMIEVMLDQIESAHVERFHLPMPTDQRLRKIVDVLYANPSDRATTGEWSHRLGMSERALFRLILKQTGMSFGRWRQQLQIILALERLAKGDAVQTIAIDLGYESASAFISMFKKAMGQPPAKYFAARLGRGEKSMVDASTS